MQIVIVVEGVFLLFVFLLGWGGWGLACVRFMENSTDKTKKIYCKKHTNMQYYVKYNYKIASEYRRLKISNNGTQYI